MKDNKTYDESEAEHLYFVGNPKKPIAIGKKKDIFACLDSEFWYIYDLYRWHKARIINITIEEHGLSVCAGVRALMEITDG